MIEILGHGDIARTLYEAREAGPGLTDDRLYYASGVSNPDETEEILFQREVDLLLAQRRDLQLVYFSSKSVLTPVKRYAFHKLRMEMLIVETFPRYVIARLGIISWGTNPKTTIPFLRGKMERREPFTIREVVRDVVEKDEFIRRVNALPRENAIVSIDGRVMTEMELFRHYVSADFPLNSDGCFLGLLAIDIRAR